MADISHLSMRKFSLEISVLCDGDLKDSLEIEVNFVNALEEPTIEPSIRNA